MQALALKTQIGSDIFDYQTLQHILSQYKQPRAQISQLLKKGLIVNIKKGLYTFGEMLRTAPLSREHLANLTYGPSYVSLDYALHYHGLIPERSTQITSVCLGRSRSFETTLGTFSYRQAPTETFHIGVARIQPNEKVAYLIASPEKALVDKLLLEKNLGLRSLKDLNQYLFEDLRIAPERYQTLDPQIITACLQKKNRPRWRLLAKHLKKQTSANT